MSIELSNADCEKGQVAQQPPISYAQPKSSTTLIASRETIKMRTPKGEFKQALLGNRVDGEECIKHISSFRQYMEKLGHEAKLELAQEATQAAYYDLTKVKGEKFLDKEIPLQKPRDLRKSGLRKKSLRKPRSLRAPSWARHMISSVNCYETTQKPNGIES